MTVLHEPVLLKEVIEELHIKNQGKYIDATEGAGGYTKAIVDAGGEVLGIDADDSMLEIAKQNVDSEKAKLVNGNFRNIKEIATRYDFYPADGIVFDLGISNVHFADEKRGFSFKNPDAILDMRLNSETQGVMAKDLLNGLREDQLEELFGRSLALRIINFRKQKLFEKVGDLLSLFPEKKFADKTHPATKAFLMLRIAVNSELENLKETLPQAIEILKPGGRLVVVSFNSSEDEIVKHYLQSKSFVLPSDEEIKRNPKSRSAILRSYVKKNNS
ncbi:MAG TPA: 16S rRNA (cytosine(1402)-N(4))-methyltransferase RsmH [Patescibacteria group bacterium]|nr:16S rRNA (cytosine(1402)-N(4))-methyltransferase RsmH [Patescibacteria group bacterium]